MRRKKKEERKKKDPQGPVLTRWAGLYLQTSRGIRLQAICIGFKIPYQQMGMVPPYYL
jgi:hypothetical protein